MAKNPGKKNSPEKASKTFIKEVEKGMGFKKKPCDKKHK